MFRFHFGTLGHGASTVVPHAAHLGVLVVLHRDGHALRAEHREDLLRERVAVDRLVMRYGASGSSGDAFEYVFEWDVR